MPEGYYLDEQDRTFFQSLRQTSERVGKRRRGSVQVHPVIGKATAAITALASGTFTLQKNKPDALANGGTRTAYALCDIAQDEICTLQWYANEESGGFWGAVGCGTTGSQVTTPCSAVTGGQLAESVDVTVSGMTGSLASIVNGTHTANEATSNCVRRITTNHPHNSGTFGTTHVQLDVGVQAIDLGGNARWEVAVSVRFGTVDGSDNFTIAGPAAFATANYHSNIVSPTVSNNVTAASTLFGSGGAVAGEIDMTGSSTQVW